jgi:universal stress protein family protein
VSELVQGVGGPDASGRVQFGRAPEHLCQIAQEESAELLVVGTKGDAAARLVLMGSVSLATVRKAPCRVAVVPSATTLEPLGAAPSRSIVCGIGHADDAEPLRVATRLARELELVPVHVVSEDHDEVAGAAVAHIRERWTERLNARAGRPLAPAGTDPETSTPRWWSSAPVAAARSAQACSARSRASWRVRAPRRS